MQAHKSIFFTFCHSCCSEYSAKAFIHLSNKILRSLTFFFFYIHNTGTDFWITDFFCPVHFFQHKLKTKTTAALGLECILFHSQMTIVFVIFCWPTSEALVSVEDWCPQPPWLTLPIPHIPTQHQTHLLLPSLSHPVHVHCPTPTRGDPWCCKRTWTLP